MTIYQDDITTHECPKCSALLDWTDLDNTLGLMICSDSECDYKCTAY